MLELKDFTVKKPFYSMKQQQSLTTLADKQQKEFHFYKQVTNQGPKAGT